MALEAYSLASGSSGNSILVRDSKTAILIDAGIGIRKLSAYLMNMGVEPASLSAILISHEHSDHINGAVRMAGRYGVPLVANWRTLAAIHGADKVPSRIIEPCTDTAIGTLSVRSFGVCHDAAHPSGYTIESGGGCVCSVTDTGKLTDRICDEAKAADLLILESNHDLQMLQNGPYPWHLKKRILGDRGHLSNDTSAGLLREIAASGKAMSVWLAHLSKTNNTPSKALTCAKHALSVCDGHALELDVARRDEPSLAWKQGRCAFQLSLFSPGRGSA
jgi:phosphoribosyl 1,2-cyclic phosphodiesterase